MVSSKLERAIGTVVGSACGDALGAPYEFRASLPDDVPVVLRAGHPWELGEWTDDTAMAVAILEALAERRSLADPATLGGVLERWLEWSRTAKDVGVQTSAVLRGLRPTEQQARASAKRVHDSRGRSGGNGSLMRTGPVALGYLDDPDGLVTAARRVSDLTHYDPDAGDACVIWSLAIRAAILTGEYDVRSGIDSLPEERRARWHVLLDEAETHHPRHYERQSGWVVGALQAAWAAIQGSTGYVDAVERAVRVGHDTDTVAAIAGALAGAKWGYSAIPWAWRRYLHGWPGLTGDDLVALSARAVAEAPLSGAQWPLVDRMEVDSRPLVPVRHPYDQGVWLGNLAGLDTLPEGVDAVVSLCRIGTGQRPVAPENHATFWLVDATGSNSDAGSVLRDAAQAVATLRAEGRTVYLHCVHAESRTPSVAVAYAVLHRGVQLEDAMTAVRSALPGAMAREVFRQDLAAL